ncbi:hypothetical protein [Asticcacaulis sp.]|uniref:hypothetical protein n=1 Tax=Asticcacaulis sp. TaxID=1872648 RepID=UPI002BACD349|nr:hypothetical protein [Asticcacaulis sp.]HTM79778.1 hypothetical protein [Asticcacaulis sp.]
MSEEIITFVIDGASARNNAIPAAAFLAKLSSFVAVIYAFERSFSHKDKRQIDLEIVDLTRNSPAQIKMRVKSKINGYSAVAALGWTFDQIDRLSRGEAIDPAITSAALDNVIDFAKAREARMPELGEMSIRYEDRSIVVDATMAERAISARNSIASDTITNWHSGVSKGSILGELRSVADIDGEREFYITPPTGAKKIRCIFPEDLRVQMRENLFKVVRAHGFLHYGSESPFPVLLEASQIEGITIPDGHFADLRGIFRDVEQSRFAGSGL